jgi:hypothetical protein
VAGSGLMPRFWQASAADSKQTFVKQFGSRNQMLLEGKNDY